MSMFGISWRPSQPGKVSFNPKNIGFSDLISAGTMFGTGGLSGIGNVAKWSTGNLAKNIGFNAAGKFAPGAAQIGNIGMLAGKTGALNSPKKPVAAGSGDYNAQIQELLSHMSQLAGQQIGFAQQNEGARQNAITGAARQLQPSSVMDSIARARQGMIANAYDSANKGNAGLASQGYASQPGVLLDALNQANSQGNKYAYDQLSPSASAGRYQQLAGLYDNSAPQAQSILQSLFAGQNQSNQNRQLNASLRQPSTLEGLVSVLPSLLPYLIKR